MVSHHDPATRSDKSVIAELALLRMLSTNQGGRAVYLLPKDALADIVFADCYHKFGTRFNLKRGPIWASVEQREPTWGGVDHHGPAWTNVNQHGPAWTNVNQHGPAWTNMGQRGPIWASVEQREPSWGGVDHHGPA
ncbi:hypothetical protein PYW07_013115 [Mythimna separata]|uniref:Uncharacterized protein n=1 Tax=Mythimna separata TaxID=271217 RepID=A0AAD7Y5S3_MYTSE|nr:hypothetical protein PYW07_013115 [Mythimna separata]